jgi:hypothetical protein
MDSAEIKRPLGRIIIALFFTGISSYQCFGAGPAQTTRPVYRDYAVLLSSFACRGGVEYDVLRKNPSILDNAKTEMSSIPQRELAWLGHDAKIAYYINLYNLYTIDLIVRHLPLKTGIKDISDPWSRRFVPLFGDTVSLDHIEHDILRKQFKEPRIHFALVCASKSCPVLPDAPYDGDSLDRQLDRAARIFLTDTTRNKFTPRSMQVSKIFDWYGRDFKEEFGSFEAFIGRTLAIPIGSKISFNPYDWSLNKVDRCK